MSDAPTDEEMHGWHRQYAADDLLIPPPPDYLRAFGDWYAAQAVEQAVNAERARAELAGAEKLNNALMNMENGDAVDFIVERKYKSLWEADNG